MIPKADPSSPPSQQNVVLGVDAGATLVKLAARSPQGDFRFELLPSFAIVHAARKVESRGPRRVGLTGGGAPGLVRALDGSPPLDTALFGEFDAWQRGASSLLQRQGEPPPVRDLLVSLGTGTSALLLEPGRISRVGGSGLGGGTLLGLGAALLGTTDFAELVRLASAGDRGRVDLLVGDIDPQGVIPLPRQVNASSFGKLARQGAAIPSRADLAHAIVGLVGENVGLICAGLAARSQARRIVFGGTTLRDNQPLREILAAIGAALGPQVVFLEDGEFAGAVGALELAADAAGSASRSPEASYDAH